MLNQHIKSITQVNRDKENRKANMHFRIFPLSEKKIIVDLKLNINETIN